ncbi:MAG: hypothetical protein ABJN57_08505 [Hyphomicrobiales bacterium]
MIKSTIALFTTLFTLFVFLSPATADTELQKEKKSGTFSSLIVPKLNNTNKTTTNTHNTSERMRNEKYLKLDCEPEETNCEQAYKNGTYNPNYNTTN